MTNPKYRGYGKSAKYPKLRQSGGNVNKSWGSSKGGGGGGGKKNNGCPLWLLLMLASAGSVVNAAVQSMV